MKNKAHASYLSLHAIHWHIGHKSILNTFDNFFFCFTGYFTVFSLLNDADFGVIGADVSSFQSQPFSPYLQKRLYFLCLITYSFPSNFHKTFPFLMSLNYNLDQNIL